MVSPIKPGARVRLNVPENARLHQAPAVVVSLADWGAFVKCPAAASGQFRALWSEMDPEGGWETPLPDSVALKVPAPVANGRQVTMAGRAKRMGYTGDVCGTCQGCRMVRAGTCLKCEDCGSTSGCS